MSNFNPSHFPLAGTSNRRTGQAVLSDVSPLHAPSQKPEDTDSEGDGDGREADEVEEELRSGPSWRGAWARRQEAARKKGKVAVPQIPDMRFEQGVMASIRPFIHRAGPVDPAAQDKHEARIEKEERAAIASQRLSAEGAEDGDPDVFVAPLRFEYGQIAYVLFRDQFLWPLLQGLMWGAGGLLLNQLWAWNRARSQAAPRTSAVGLGRLFGIQAK